MNVVLVAFGLAAIAGLAFVYGLSLGSRRGEDAVRDSEGWYEREAEQARHELATARQRRDEESARAEALTVELQEVRHQLKVGQANTRAAAADDAVAALRQRHEELEQEHIRNARLREVDRSRMQQLRDELQRLENALAGRDERIIAAERSAAEARATLAAMRSNDSARIEAARLVDVSAERQRIAELEEELRANAATADRLGAELAALEESYSRELAERDAELASLRDSYQSARDELQQLHVERVEIRERASSAAGELAALRTEVTSLGEQLQTERSRSARLLADRREREVALDTARAAALADDERLQGLLRQQEERLTTLQQRLATSDGALEQIEAREREARQQLLAVQESLEAERLRARSSLERGAELAEALRSAQESLDSERSERATAQAAIDVEVGNLRERLQGRDEDLAALQEQLDSRAAALERLAAELTQQQESTSRQDRERQHTLGRLQRQLEDARTEIAAVENRRVLAEKHLDSMLARAEHQGHAAAEAGAEARRHAANAAEVGAELQRHVELLAAARADLESRNAEAVRVERDLREELRSLQAELSRQRDGAASSLRRLHLSEEAQRAAERQASEHAARVQELTREIDHVLDTRERLLRDLHEREEQVRRMRSRLASGDDPVD